MLITIVSQLDVRLSDLMPAAEEELSSTPALHQRGSSDTPAGVFGRLLSGRY